MGHLATINVLIVFFSLRARYVSPVVYGTEALDRYGSWRTLETYGAVRVPGGSSGRLDPFQHGTLDLGGALRMDLAGRGTRGGALLRPGR